MTALPLAPARTATAPDDRLRRVLLADGAVTAAVGAGTLLAAAPLAEQLPGSPTVLRVLGAVLLVVGADVALAARVRTARLALAGRVVGELALLWAAVSTVVVLWSGAGATVTAAVLLVAAVCVGFGVVELRLARQVTAAGAASGR